MKTAKIILLSSTIMLFWGNSFAQKPMVDGAWKINSIKDSGKMIDLRATETTVEMNAKGKSILVYLGCNRLTAKLEFITGDKIKPFELAATRKACKDEKEQLESVARYVLEQTNSIRKSGAKMEFYKDNDILMVLERPVVNSKHHKK